jgi:hypothetical protein
MKKLLIIYLTTLTLLMLMIASISCQPKDASQTGGGDDGAKQDTLGVKAETLRNNWQTKLKGMNIKELHQQLCKESMEGMEPFNSMALKETVSREKNSFDELSTQLEKTRSSLLSLMALREIDNIKYKVLPDSLKASILLDALKNAKTYNTFGLPHVRWEAAARAIIEIGDAGRKGLMELLKDTRPAPVWGSEDYSEYVHYQYRVCDYAYALLTAKGAEPVNLPEKSEARDRMIQSLLEQK